MDGGLFAHYGATRKWPLSAAMVQNLSEHQLRRQGEPFLLHRDPRINLVPLVRLFGPGHFWRVPGEIPMVGAGHDGFSKEESLRIYDWRREGVVYGKWFSKFCPEGDLGLKRYAELELIPESEYLEALLALRRRTCSKSGS